MMRHWTKAFAFTFRHQALSRGYVLTLVIVAIALLTLIPGALLLADSLGSSATGITWAYCVGDFATECRLAAKNTPYAQVTFEQKQSLETAEEALKGQKGAIILLREADRITALTAGDVSLSDAEACADCLAQGILYQQAMSDPLKQAEMRTPVRISQQDGATAGGETSQLKEILSMLAPYAMVLLLYFMILIYGQSVANFAILEKNNKLMDLFLVSLRPQALLTGKVLAVAAAGLIQTAAWLGSAYGGVWLGCQLVRAVNPGTELGFLKLIDAMGGLKALVSPGQAAVIAALLMAGFLMYCALSGLGGALASKPEDLSVTNYFFTLALVVSFLICLFTGDQAGQISQAGWLGFVPFTAVLVLPGRILAGQATLGQGALATLITAGSALGLMLLGGKAYAMTAFYRGRPMNPVQLLRQRTKGKRA